MLPKIDYGPPLPPTDAASAARRHNMAGQAVQGDAPGLGRVAKLAAPVCPQCKGAMVLYFDPTTGKVVATPPCDSCAALDVVYTVARWGTLSPAPAARKPSDHPMGDETHAPVRVPTGSHAVPPAPHPQVGLDVWRDALSRHARGEWGEFPGYGDLTPTPPDVFAPELAGPFARNRVNAETRTGVVRSRHHVVSNATPAVVDVVTLYREGDSPSTYLMVAEPGSPCFGVRLPGRDRTA